MLLQKAPRPHLKVENVNKIKCTQKDEERDGNSYVYGRAQAKRVHKILANMTPGDVSTIMSVLQSLLLQCIRKFSELMHSSGHDCSRIFWPM